MNSIPVVEKKSGAMKFVHDTSTGTYLAIPQDGQVVRERGVSTSGLVLNDLTTGHRLGVSNKGMPRRRESPTRGVYGIIGAPALPAGTTVPSSPPWQPWQALEAEEISLPIPVEEVMDRQVGDLLRQIYRLDAGGDLQAATDLLFDRVDKLLVGGAFDVCDKFLKRVQVERLSTSLMRSFLAITYPAKGRLASRPGLFSRIESRMRELRGTEVTKRLLNRLA